MARLAKMSVTPAEPLRCGTTEFTLEFNEINAMLRTVFYWNVTTFWAYQLFFIKTLLFPILVCIHHLSTVLSSSKIWFFTLETHEVRINGHRILHRFIVVFRFFVHKFFVFFTFLEFQSFQRHFLDKFIKLSHLFNFIVKLIFRGHFDPFFAQRTYTKVEKNSWSEPLDLKSLFDTSEVENVTASTLNCRRSVQSLRKTNRAIIITGLAD
jgi:hypothetical protein